MTNDIARHLQGAADLNLESLTKNFAGHQAVQKLDLTMAAGELIALLGPSGCGKTTTLRMVAGFETPDSGRIVLSGRDITRVPTNRRGLGMVFQNYSLFPHKTVAENIAFGLRMAKVGQTERDQRVATFLDLVKMSSMADRYPAQLSGGQQQRIALARSLVVGPKVLLLDEPLGALDRNLREDMQFELRAMQQRLGITTLLVTHDQEEALSMSDRVAVMNEGRILQIGAPAEIYDRPKTRFVAEFLGTSNLFEGVVSRADNGPVLDLGGSLPPIRLGQAAPAGERILISVRPERIMLGGDAAENQNCFEAEVTGVIFRGSHAAYRLRQAGRDREIVVYRQAGGLLGHVAHGVGERLAVGWRPDDAVILEMD